MEDAGTMSGPPANSLSSGESGVGGRWRKRVTLGSLIIVLIAAAVVLPPLINVGRYQRQVTTLVSRSLGRPVQLSSVGLRLLPRPGFILHDLSVAEDPGFGTEPILSARTVVASIGILSLWKGRLAIDRVSVDEASLNLVQTAEGRWNLESLMMGAQPSLANGSSQNPSIGLQAKPGKSAAFPYLEATNSRVNLKHGLEKSPFSIVNTDLSLWQPDVGQWRVRLRGQPVRTDMEMSWADTGEVRMEANLHSAAQLREMPFNLQMEWRDAQVGQLSRLLFGSDAGWRGDLTADINVQGTADSAHTKARLQAAGVRREEFAPETPLDFDANCNLVYEHAANAVHAMSCDTALGSGQLHLKAELPGTAGPPEAMLEVTKVPLQAGLDFLRTVRAGFAPGISAKGTINGSLSYKRRPFQLETKLNRPKTGQKMIVHKTASPKITPPPPGDLQGQLTVDGGILKGGQLTEPLTLPAMIWAPSSSVNEGLETKFTIALASAPLAAKTAAAAVQPPPNQGLTRSDTAEEASPEASPPAAQSISIRLAVAPRRYQLALTGAVATPRLRSLAYAFGLPHSDRLDGFSGGSADLAINASGPWIVSEDSSQNSSNAVSVEPVSQAGPAAKSSNASAAIPSQTADEFTGSVVLHHVRWQAAYLLRPATLQQANFNIVGSNISFTSDFAFGGSKATAEDALKGIITFQTKSNCEGLDCAPEIQMHFAALDAAQVQAAVIGVPEQKSLLSPLMDRVRGRGSDKTIWQPLTLQIDADSLSFGPTTLHKPVAVVHISNQGDFEIKSWNASLLGGTASGSGSFERTNGTPLYEFEGSFTDLNPAAVGSLAAAHWAALTSTGKTATNGNLSGKGKLKLSGLDWKELEASASGKMHFEWPGGTITTASGQPIRFENWSGTLIVQNGKAQLAQNELTTGKHPVTMTGTIPLSGTAKLSVGSPLKDAPLQ